AHEVDDLANTGSNLGCQPVPFSSLSYIHDVVRYKADNKFQITQLNAIRSIPAYAPILFPTSLHLMTTGKSERALLLFLLNRPLTMESLHYRKISSSPLLPLLQHCGINGALFSLLQSFRAAALIAEGML